MIKSAENNVRIVNTDAPKTLLPLRVTGLRRRLVTLRGNKPGYGEIILEHGKKKFQFPHCQVYSNSTEMYLNAVLWLLIESKISLSAIGP